MWRGCTKIKLHKSIVYKKEVPLWLGPIDFSILEVLDWLTRITFIYKRKAVPLRKKLWINCGLIFFLRVATAPDKIFFGEGPHDTYLRRPHHSWMRSEKFWDFIPSRLASPKVSTDNSHRKFICSIKYTKESLNYLAT